MADGLTQETAAAVAGMSVRTARTWQEGPLPSETKQERQWRTRKDPFEAVWDSHVVPLLKATSTAGLEARDRPRVASPPVWVWEAITSALGSAAAGRSWDWGPLARELRVCTLCVWRA